MLHFKACPRCGGDIHVNSDVYGEYKECLQCGMIQDIERANDILAPVLVKSRSKKKVA